MQSGVALPWPTEPVMCRSCERWVGRARAVAGPQDANGGFADEASSAAPHIEPEHRAHEDRVTRSRRPRPARLGTLERRRARELGPPPVPGFASEEPFTPEPADHEQAGTGEAATFAAAAGAGAESAPADVTPNGGIEHPATDHAADADVTHPAEGIAAPDEPGADVGDGADQELHDHAAGNGAVEPLAGSSEESERGDGALYADAGAGFAPPEADGHPAPGGDTTHEPAPPAEEGAPAQENLLRLPSDEPGHTLPFWAVEEEPPKRRRLRLPRLGRPSLRRPQLRKPTRAGVVRALPYVLLVIGGLLLVEGAVTVLWKEPFSAIFAAQSQQALGDELEKLEREAAAEAARNRKQMVAYHRKRSVSLNRERGVGEAVGRLRIKKLGLNEVVVQGTDDVTIQKGPGHYMETPLPGQKGDWTVGIAGHRTTYGAPFRRINELERGDPIVFSVPYGRFTYEVEKTKIVDAGYTQAMVPQGSDKIVLTACHPLYSAAQRILVYGKLKKSEPRGGAKQVPPARP